MKPNRKLSTGIFLASMLPIVLSIINARPEGIYCSILALLYILIYWQKIEVYKYGNSICGFFVCFLTLVRYYIVPVLIIIDPNYMTYRPLGLFPNELFFKMGISMTLWEMLAFSFFYYKITKGKKHEKQNEITLSRQFHNSKIFSWYILIVLFGCLLLVNPSILKDYSFVTNLNAEDTVLEEYVPKSLTETIATIGSRVLKIIIPIPFLCYFYNKDLLNKSRHYYFLSLVIIVFFYGFILEGNSRNSIIIPSVAAMFILLRTFPRFKKTTLSLLVSSILLISGLSLIWKSFGGDYTTAKDSSLSYWISYIEIYFAGISNVGKAVYAFQETQIFINPIIAINDLFRNVPFINALINNSNTSSYYFQKVWGRSDQVIPAIGNGLFYVGYVFAPCVSFFIFKLAKWFEIRALRAVSLPECIIYSFSCVVISYNMFNSVSTMMMKLSITLVPVLFTLYVYNKIIKYLK